MPKTKIVLIGFALILVALIGYLGDANKLAVPAITNDEALKLVGEQWGDCSTMECSTVSVTVSENETEGWFIRAVYDGLRDDSVSAQSVSAPVSLENGVWVFGEKEITWKCQENRGHQDFSKENCM